MDLPVDVWLHIASFIPTEQLRTMYGVNRIFFDLAIDIRYKEVDLYRSRKEKVISRTLSRSRLHVHRIRTLNLRPNIITSYLASNKTANYMHKLQRPILDALHRFRFRIRPPALPPTLPAPATRAVRFAKLTSDLIGTMPNVEELNVEELWDLSEGPVVTQLVCFGRDLKDLEYVMQTVIAIGWTTFGSTLRRLKLHLPHSCYSVTAMPTLALVFPSLEELDITLSTLEFLRDRVVPFVNDHHSTLQSLKLSFDSAVPEYGLNALSCFSQIRHIPKLSTFHLHYYVLHDQKFGASDLETFLLTHSTGLRALRLDLSLVCHRYLRTYAPVLHVALPYLASLELAWVKIENIVAYVQQYGRSLAVLKLENTLLLSRDVELLLNVLTKYCELRALTIYTYYLNPELLDLLAMKLPSLDQLYMKFECITLSKSTSGINTWQFCSEMRDRSYPEWKLRHFVGWHRGPVPPSEITLLHCEAALRAAIPNLDTVMLHTKRFPDVGRY